MRVGNVKTSKESLEDEPQAKHCNNCRRSRLEFHLSSQPYNRMMVCTNIKCFLYTDITKFITWIQ